ncbi:COX7 [Candida theae]|uniref:COX7 n=1 Tax=Candida theae TaxID=1198502 RepID=A0AAD5BF47_9ASCO|nr:COX7 [Candida theae]KAI5958355.1 COX7 [Candida theae]
MELTEHDEGKAIYISIATSEMNPQRIIELQKRYQTTPKPLYLRGARSALLVYPFYALFAVTTAVPLYYTGRAIIGLKEKN